MYNLLEDYLTEVERNLAPMPSARRNDELNEVRDHLLHAVAVNREKGQTEDEAVRAVLEQFGESNDFGESLVLAWQRGERRENRRSFLGALVCTIFSMYVGISLIGKVVDMTSLRRSEVYYQHSWMIETLLFLSAALVMALAGGISGLAFPKRAVKGTAFAVVVSYAVSLYLRFMQTPPATDGWRELVALVVIIMGNVVFFGTPAVTSAWGTSRWRPRQARPTHE